MVFRLKNLEVLNLDETLQRIVLEVARQFDLWTITSCYRPADDGVHGTQPVRGLDLRCRDYFIGQHVANWVNSRWQYDPDRPDMDVALCHDTGRGLHLHFQSHYKTRRKKWTSQD